MRYFIGLVIGIVIIGGAWFFLKPKSSNAPSSPETPGTTAQPSKRVDSAPVTEVVVSGKNFSFSQKEIRVKKGARVRVVFTSENGFHDWVVDEFSAHTRRLNSGETDTIEFTPDKAGSFEYYCSVGSHRRMGMVGTLVVEE